MDCTTLTIDNAAEPNELLMEQFRVWLCIAILQFILSLDINHNFGEIEGEISMRTTLHATVNHLIH
jgi:hypothetical protein